MALGRSLRCMTQERSVHMHMSLITRLGETEMVLLVCERA